MAMTVKRPLKIRIDSAPDMADCARKSAVPKNVRQRHLADNSAAPANSRFWTKTDKVGFWPGTVCPLMTQIELIKKKRDPIQLCCRSQNDDVCVDASADAMSAY